MLGKVVSKTGSKVRAQGMLYKVVSQSVLLYKKESWVITGEMIKVLESFHYQVARSIMGMEAQCTRGKECPPVVEVL